MKKQDKKKSANPEKESIKISEGTQTHKQKNISRKKHGVVKAKELSERDKYIIEEYFSNGYNKSKAVTVVLPTIKNQSQAVQVFNSIASKTMAKKYINSMHSRLRASVHISKEQVLKEFINSAFTDATDYIGLTVEELKNLPAAARRQIQSFKLTDKKEETRGGNVIETRTIDIKLINKLDALKETTKIIGGYEVDNKQKNKNNIDLTAIGDKDKAQLYSILMQSISKDKETTVEVHHKVVE